MSARTAWYPCSSDFRPQNLPSSLHFIITIFSLYQEKKTTSYVFLDIGLPPSLINRNIFSPLGMFYLCILHVASPLADGWGIACVLPPFVRTYLAMLLREQRVGFCVFFPPPRRERGMWLPTANLKKFEY